MKQSKEVNDMPVSQKKDNLIVKKIKGYLRFRAFAIPTVLLASIIMLTMLVVAISSIITVRLSVRDQLYNRLTATASSAGMAYAEACLAANNGVPLPTWTDINPIKPNTDCGGNLLVDCTVGNNLTTNSLCYVAFNNSSTGKVVSSFTVNRPALNAGGKAISVVSNGTTDLLRVSNDESWRTYKQSGRLDMVAGGTYTFTTPGLSTVVLSPAISSVQIEVWGAGTSGFNGGYAKGTKTITTDRTLYIHIGNQAGTIGGSLGGAGGAYGTYYLNPPGPAEHGAASTDVRLVSDISANRIIVAGGAGGGQAGGGSGGMAGPDGGAGQSGVYYNYGSSGGGGGYVGGTGGIQILDDYDNPNWTEGLGGTSYVTGLTNTLMTAGVASGNGKNGKVVIQTFIGNNSKIYY